MPVFLYRIWKKTNDGPWTYPSNYTGEEMGKVVSPYLRALYSNCPGIMGPEVMYFETSNTFVRKYTIDTVENAIKFYKFMTDTSRPETQAMRALAKKYSDAAGTTYEAQWKLSQPIEKKNAS